MDKRILLGLILISFVSLSFAQFGETNEVTARLIKGLNELCVNLTSILPIIAILLFVLAAVIYGVGHVFGAEMKSKATGWATSMVVGAVISLLIFLLTKPVLGVFVPEIETTNFCTQDFS